MRHNFGPTSLIIHTCKKDDTYEARCEIQKLVTLQSESSIRLKVEDQDGWEADDPAGEGSLKDLLKTGVAYEDIELQTTDPPNPSVGVQTFDVDLLNIANPPSGIR